jgi:hypothetical protein
LGGLSEVLIVECIGGGAPINPVAPADFDWKARDRHHPVHQVGYISAHIQACMPPIELPMIRR